MVKVGDSEEKLTLKPEEARKWLGRGTDFIRELLISGVEWGEAVKMPSGQWNFIIYTAKLLTVLGIPHTVVIKKAPEDLAGSTSANN
ncbi:hypothetical protein [Fusobacterium ulcerans]|uniref:hypothetical protein n=1 Tax=Fusobacterium ulcerans TaxID=861 RepID=UPI001032056D|nr:hypothetical protein [Fusobacterium ulcerans]